MKISPYFSQLKESYQSEIDDLRFDSEGKDVLNARLTVKRQLFKELLPMMEIAPEMVAATFHGSITVNDREQMETFVLEGPGALASWEVVSGSLTVRADLAPLIGLALTSDGGDEFLVTMACLQFLFAVQEQTIASEEDEDLSIAEEQGDEQGDEAGDQEAGTDKAEDWLSEHGFDRRNTF